MEEKPSPACECGEWDSWFDRSVCPEPCGSMHNRCAACGKILGYCPIENRPAPKAFLWVLRAFRSRGPNIVGYDSHGRARSYMKMHSPRKGEENMITLFDDGTWKKGLHE